MADQLPTLWTEMSVLVQIGYAFLAVVGFVCVISFVTTMDSWARGDRDK